jgi:hypothetical protein
MASGSASAVGNNAGNYVYLLEETTLKETTAIENKI